MSRSAEAGAFLPAYPVPSFGGASGSVMGHTPVEWWLCMQMTIIAQPACAGSMPWWSESTGGGRGASCGSASIELFHSLHVRNAQGITAIPFFPTALLGLEMLGMPSPFVDGCQILPVGHRDAQCVVARRFDTQ